MQNWGVSCNSVDLFRSIFCKKNQFYRKNIQYLYNFYGTDLHVNVCRGVFRTQCNIYGRASLRKLQKCFIVDVQVYCRWVPNMPLLLVLQ